MKLSTEKAATADPSASPRHAPNPLWVITAALALFLP